MRKMYEEELEFFFSFTTKSQLRVRKRKIKIKKKKAEKSFHDRQSKKFERKRRPFSHGCLLTQYIHLCDTNTTPYRYRDTIRYRRESAFRRKKIFILFHSLKSTSHYCLLLVVCLFLSIKIYSMKQRKKINEKHR